MIALQHGEYGGVVLSNMGGEPVLVDDEPNDQADNADAHAHLHDTRIPVYVQYISKARLAAI